MPKATYGLVRLALQRPAAGAALLPRQRQRLQVHRLWPRPLTRPAVAVVPEAHVAAVLPVDLVQAVEQAHVEPLPAAHLRQQADRPRVAHQQRHWVAAAARRLVLRFRAMRM
jgi:hypothetical protein